MDQIRMTKEDAVKLVTSAEIKAVLLAEGWKVEGEEVVEQTRRGRPRKDEE